MAYIVINKIKEAKYLFVLLLSCNSLLQLKLCFKILVENFSFCKKNKTLRVPNFIYWNTLKQKNNLITEIYNTASDRIYAYFVPTPLISSTFD